MVQLNVPEYNSKQNWQGLTLGSQQKPMQIQLTSIMLTVKSKNLSHRHLIKEKTKELFYYPSCLPKTTKNLGLRPIDITNTLNSNHQQNDDDTSIILEKERLDSSINKKKSQGQSKSRSNTGVGSGVSQPVRRLSGIIDRLQGRKFKSLEAISKDKSASPKSKSNYLIKKIDRIHRSGSEQKLGSMENIENNEAKKKISMARFEMPRSQNNLKPSLRKTTTSKMKLKVVDPFQKRTKLDLQFQNESVIGKVEQSMISTINQQEFQSLLRDLI